MRSSPSVAPLIPIAQRGLPFTSADGQAFVRLDASNGGFYILPVRSPAYREWFLHRFFAEHDALPSPQAFCAILNHLEAQASQGENQRFLVWRRVGSRGPGAIPKQLLLDLASAEGRFVEISADGWRVTAGQNALFETSLLTVSLPEPIPAPDGAPSALETLRSCLNLPDRGDWLRCLAWLIAAFRPSGPFPVLIVQ